MPQQVLESRPVACTKAGASPMLQVEVNMNTISISIKGFNFENHQQCECAGYGHRWGREEMAAATVGHSAVQESRGE